MLDRIPDTLVPPSTAPCWPTGTVMQQHERRSSAEVEVAMGPYDDAVAQVVRELGGSAEDREALGEALRGMGSIDPVLGERAHVERVSLLAAADSPLKRTGVLDTPQAGETAVFYARTMRLPSGRVVQAQRRYPSEAELLGAAATLPDALVVREITLPPGAEAMPLEVIDAGTVVAVDADGAPLA